MFKQTTKLNLLMLLIFMALFLAACGAPKSESVSGGADAAVTSPELSDGRASEEALSETVSVNSTQSANVRVHTNQEVLSVAVSMDSAQPANARAQTTQLALSPASPAESNAGGKTSINDAAYDMTFFENYGVNPFVDTEDDHLSTFAMDVDTASYAVARRFVTDGYMPDPDSIRVEEFINYFDHAYEPPTSDAFAIHLEGAPSPFGTERHNLVRVGLQGKVIDDSERKDASLVFVIDVSGSMDQENRLGLVKETLRLLLDELRSTDEVGIVVYGSRAYTILEPTRATERGDILNAINQLRPDGSTNAEEGLILGYQMAVRMVNQAQQGDRIVRLILCSDGVANVGNTGPDSILGRVRDYVDQSITLSTVGFGMGNYNDVLMEQLANDGNGNYRYVDTLDEAKRVFVENLTGLLQVIAKDAKVQVEFNQDVVRSYRLLGYENRDVADEDFRNDHVDAGEVGAGHSVTALYEIKLEQDVDATSDTPIATVYVRYEEIENADVKELSQVLTLGDLHGTFAASSPTFKLDATVVEYAELLRESYWAQDGSFADVLTLAQEVKSLFANDAERAEDVVEFVDLVAQAERIANGG